MNVASIGLFALSQILGSLAVKKAGVAFRTGEFVHAFGASAYGIFAALAFLGALRRQA